MAYVEDANAIKRVKAVTYIDKMTKMKKTLASKTCIPTGFLCAKGVAQSDTGKGDSGKIHNTKGWVFCYT